MCGASDPAASADPGRISVSKSRGLVVEWRDGHRSEYGLRYLRDRCGCAACMESRSSAGPGPSPFPMFQPALRLVNVEPVGRYALRLAWSDGHNSGIYSWEYLRRICPCAQCGSQPGA